jgi:predicted Zn-dependent peptidase
MNFDRTQLENGLTLLGERNPGAKSMAAGYFVRTGSRDETAEISGVSHFLEHMMFKGSDRRTGEDVNREFDEMGARYNAFTSEENTVYYGAVLPEFQPRVLDLLSDLMRPTLRSEDFDMEKNVILEEIARYQDRPSFTVMDVAREVFFAGHPLGNSVLGTTGSIQALARDQMAAYFDRRYAANNLSLVLSGNYDWDAAVAQVCELTASWNAADAGRELAEPRPQFPVRVITNDKFNRAHLEFVAPGVAAQSPDRFPAEVVAEVLGAGEGSRLFWALVDPGLAEAARLGHSEEDGAGAFMAYVSCDPDRAQEVVDKVREVLATATREGLRPEEVERARRKLASAIVLQGETPFGRLLQVGFDWQYRREMVPIGQTIDGYLAVTTEAANALLSRGLFDRLALVALGPIRELH